MNELLFLEQYFPFPFDHFRKLNLPLSLCLASCTVMNHPRHRPHFSKIREGYDSLQRSPSLPQTLKRQLRISQISRYALLMSAFQSSHFMFTNTKKYYQLPPVFYSYFDVQTTQLFYKKIHKKNYSLIFYSPFFTLRFLFSSFCTTLSVLSS